MKPGHLYVDGEIFVVVDQRNDPDIAVAYVSGARMNLSPFEAEELRDWLTSFLDWYYQKGQEE